MTLLADSHRHASGTLPRRFKGRPDNVWVDSGGVSCVLRTNPTNRGEDDQVHGGWLLGGGACSLCVMDVCCSL